MNFIKYISFILLFIALFGCGKYGKLYKQGDLQKEEQLNQEASKGDIKQEESIEIDEFI